MVFCDSIDSPGKQIAFFYGKMKYVLQNPKILIGIFQPIFPILLTKIETDFLQCVAITVKCSITDSEKRSTFIFRLGIAVRKKKDKPEYPMGFRFSWHLRF